MFRSMVIPYGIVIKVFSLYLQVGQVEARWELRVCSEPSPIHMQNGTKIKKNIQRSRQDPILPQKKLPIERTLSPRGKKVTKSGMGISIRVFIGILRVRIGQDTCEQ